MGWVTIRHMREIKSRHCSRSDNEQFLHKLKKFPAHDY